MASRRPVVPRGRTARDPLAPRAPRPRKRFGQHFLEATWIAKIADALALAPSDTVVEIGPGRGAITRALAARAAHVLAVEIDRDLSAALVAEAPPNVRVLCRDFLTMSLEEIEASGARVRVVGNLPYYVSTPILIRLIEWARQSPVLVDATLMLQKEVAERVASPPGSKSYGTLSIVAQTVADVEWLLDVPAGAFRPVPSVESAVIRLRFRGPTSLPPTLDGLVKGLFSQRRKTLANALRTTCPHVLTTAFEDVLRDLGVSSRARPETLTPAQFVELARALDGLPRRPAS